MRAETTDFLGGRRPRARRLGLCAEQALEDPS